MTETLGSADASLNVPLHRLGNVRDIANAALFLASNESDFITGATIDVNGGMGMRQPVTEKSICHMKNVKSETALKFGVGIYRNNSEKKVYECGGKKNDGYA